MFGHGRFFVSHIMYKNIDPLYHRGQLNLNLRGRVKFPTGGDDSNV
jgi:hypothetical protein